MKKVLFSVIVMISLNSFAQKDSLKIGGSITLQTQTNALVTGGRFSDKPALKGQIFLSKKSSTFSVTRNSDLADPKNNANFTSALYSFSKKLGDKFKITPAIEIYIFDTNKNMNMLLPSLVTTYYFNKTTNVNLTGYYIKFLEGAKDAYSIKLDVGKKVEKYGLEFRIYGFYVDWNGQNFSAVAEVSKTFNRGWKVSMYQHWNKFNSKVNYAQFGAIRLIYNF